MTATVRYELGGFRLDPARRRLETAEGEAVVTTAKAFDALVYFAGHAGVPISRRKLIEALWPDTIVDENSLSQAIAALRRALGEGYVVTVPGRGYQFVADVRALSSEAVEVVQATPDAEPAGFAWRRRPVVAAALMLAVALAFTGLRQLAVDDSPLTIAVMPFENLSSDPEQEYFSDGLTDELIAVLAAADLRVTARDSSFALRDSGLGVEQIAAKLGVDYVLGGSVARDQDELRIRVRLSDSSGLIVSAPAFNFGLEEIFEAQQDLARTVLAELQMNVGSTSDLRRTDGPEDFGALVRTAGDGAYAVSGGTENVKALDHYLLGQFLKRRGSPDALLKAVAEFEQALDLDAGFGLAQMGLAQSFERLTLGSTEVDDIASFAEKHARAVERVMELAPELPAALWLIAQRHSSARRWQNAEAALKEWVARSSDDYDAVFSYGTFLNRVGRARHALPYLEQARRLNPLLADPLVELSMAHDALGNRDRAVELNAEASHMVGYTPMSAAPQFWRLLAADDTAGARSFFVHVQVEWAGLDAAELEAMLRSGHPDVVKLDNYVRSTSNGTATSWGGLVGGSILDLDDPDRGLERLRIAYADPGLSSSTGMGNLSGFAAHFGDPNLSVAALRRIVPTDPYGVLHYAWTPIMQSVRRLDEFKDLMRELEIVGYWRASGWPEQCRPLGGDDFECH